MRHLPLALLLPLLLAVPAVLLSQPGPDRYDSFRLTAGPGEQSPARRLEQIAHDGNVTVENDELVIVGGGDAKLPRATICLADSCLDKYFELTVTARGNDRAAQIMLTEGFRWGSHEPVLRFVRHRLPATDDFAATTIFFHVARLPFFLNFGIYPNNGPEQCMRVKSFTLRETDAQTYLRQSGLDEIPVPDRNRFTCVRDALTQFTGNADRLLAAGFLPPALRKIVCANAARAAGLALANTPESLAAADPVLSAGETFGVMLGQDLAPASIPATAGPVRLTLFNLHSPHAVWARFEADIPGVEYRVVTPGGEKHRLNQGHLAIVPSSEPATIEVTGLTSPGRLTVFPLDHHGKNTVTTIEVH